MSKKYWEYLSFLYSHYLQKLKATVTSFGRIILYQVPQSMSVLMAIHPGFFLSIYRRGGLSTVIKRAAKNMDTFVTLDGTYRYWIQYPEAWQTTPDGLKYRITSELEVSGTQTAGVKTVVTPVGYHTWVNTYGCRDVGGTYDFGVASVSGVNIEIDRGTAWPGVYSIQLPVKVAYEENKGNYDGKDGGGWTEFPAAMKSFAPVDSKGISITISSKCNVGEQRRVLIWVIILLRMKQNQVWRKRLIFLLLVMPRQRYHYLLKVPISSMGSITKQNVVLVAVL
ncbi:hypothetical protein MLI45_24745 [Escherichia coli]|nr:hypothetical protein [Escherichia coli]